MGLTKPRAAQIYNLDYKQATRVVTVTNITLAGGTPSSVDGVSLSLHDRVLVTGQSTTTQNGLYYVTTVGSGSNGTWARTSDGNETGEIESGMIVMVTEGATYADTQWKLITDDPITIGSTALIFTQNYSANSISGGSSNVTVFSNANVTISSAGTPNVLTVSSTGTVTSGTASVTGNITGGNANIIGTTASTSKTTGALKVAGGVGVAGDLYAGNSIAVDGGTYGNVVTTQYASVFASGAGPNPYSVMQVRSSDGVSGMGMQAYTASNGLLYANTGITFQTGATVRDKDIPTGGTTRATIDSTGLAVTGIVSASGNVTGSNIATAGNISATGNIAGNYFLGNVFYASGITASKIYSGASEVNVVSGGGNVNVSIGGTSNVAVFAPTGAYVTGQISATGDITGANLTVSGNIMPTANNVYALGSPTMVFQHLYVGPNSMYIGGSPLSTIDNGVSLLFNGEPIVTANTDGTSTTYGNMVIVGNITGSNILTGGQVSATGNLSGDYLLANIAFATGYTASKIYNGTSEANIGTSDGNANISVGGTSNVVVVAPTGEYVTGLLSVTGNTTSGNLLTAGLVSATGNITGGNVNATNYTGTDVSVTGIVTAASTVGGVITGSSASVTGNVTGTHVVATTSLTNGNITITGANIISAGPTIYIDPNGTGGTDGEVIITGNLSVQGNVTYINSNNVTTNDLTINLANNAASASEANGGGIGVGPAGSEYISLTYNSTSNIWVASNGLTSQGILSATGNVTGGNLLTTGLISASGNIRGQNIQIGNATGFGNAEFGNVNSAYISSATIVTAIGNVIAGNVITDGYVSAVGNISTLAEMYVGGNIAVTAAITVGGSVIAESNLFANAIVSAAGNVVGANFTTVGNVTATGNVIGSNILGNGAGLSGVYAYKTIKVDGGAQSDLVANSIASTLNVASGSGIALTTDAANGILTISTVSTSSIFSSGGDMGTITEPVTASEDLGSVIDIATIFYDLGSVVSASGLIYPSQLILPTYTVGTLPGASPAAQFVYLSTSSIGAMTAFSDGTNWRFTSTGNIVS